MRIGYLDVHSWPLDKNLRRVLIPLRDHKISILVDVRRWPTSKHSPHFNRENRIRAVVKCARMQYIWLGDALGGYRRYGIGEGSPNKGWTSIGYRNYVDHALSEDFQEAIRRLIQLFEVGETSIICAEKHY